MLTVAVTVALVMAGLAALTVAALVVIAVTVATALGSPEAAAAAAGDITVLGPLLAGASEFLGRVLTAQVELLAGIMERVVPEEPTVQAVLAVLMAGAALILEAAAQCGLFGPEPLVRSRAPILETCER
jgi:hypothetical protein